MDTDDERIELGPLSLEWLEIDPGPCGCGREIGAGLVGYRKDPPGALCDVCCLGVDTDLAMALWMIHFARSIAEEATETADRLHADQCALTLLKLAQLLHPRSKSPLRPAAASQRLQDLQERLMCIVWDDLVRMLRMPPC